MKNDAEAFGALLLLINDFEGLQIEKRGSQYELTVWKYAVSNDHKHFQGSTLIEAILKARKAL